MGSCHLGNCHLGSLFLENAFDKVNMNVAGNSKVITLIQLSLAGWSLEVGWRGRRGTSLSTAFPVHKYKIKSFNSERKNWKIYLTFSLFEKPWIFTPPKDEIKSLNFQIFHYIIVIRAMREYLWEK